MSDISLSTKKSVHQRARRTFSLLKSIEFPPATDEQTENSTPNFSEQNRPIKIDQTQIKVSESKYNSSDDRTRPFIDCSL